METAEGFSVIKAGSKQPSLLSKEDIATAAAVSQSPRKESNHGRSLIIKKMVTVTRKKDVALSSDNGWTS